MTVTLELKPEIEAGLTAQARATGVSLQAYILDLLEHTAAIGDERHAATLAREEAVRGMLEFGNRHGLSLGERVSRRILHEGHRV